MEINISPKMTAAITQISRTHKVPIEQLQERAPQIMDYIGQNIVPMLQEGVKRVYWQNSKHADGSLPVDEVCQSVTYTLSPNNPWGITLFLDDSLIHQWATKSGAPIYRIGGPDESGNAEVHSFAEHWRLPIFGIPEESYMERYARQEIQAFLANPSTWATISRMLKT